MKANRNSKKNGKHKGTNSSADQVPKKQCIEKHCSQCQKHGSTSSTHKTSKCTKYKKDGTLQAALGKNSSVKTACKTKTLGGKSFVQALELKKSVKKMSKSSSKRKHHYSGISDSNSI
jgi:hypothetical protein